VRAVAERRRATKESLKQFVGGLGARAGLRPEVRDTARALAMYGSDDTQAQELATAYFLCDALDPRAWWDYGLGAVHGPERAVQQLSEVLALTGHCVIAVDQLDPLFARAASSLATVDSSQPDPGRDHLVHQVAQGLMGLREGTHRTLTLLA